MKKYTGKSEFEAGIGGSGSGGAGSISSGRSGLSKMADFMVNRKSGYTGIDHPATGEVKGRMRVINPNETIKKAEPLTKREKGARNKANNEAQSKIGKEFRTTRAKDENYDADMPTELEFKKGGAVRSKASKRADGCAVRGKTRA